MNPKKIESVLFIHPNYTLLGKRSWPLAPYNLALLNACIKDKWDSDIVDFNLGPSDEDDIRRELRARRPDVVGITSFSTEYYAEVHRHAAIIREELPDTVILGGGAYPTVLPEQAAMDPNVDYWIIGEGEYRLPMLLEALEKGKDPAEIEGIACHRSGKPYVNPMTTFIDDLDALPYPDYGSLDLPMYGSRPVQYAHYLVTRQYPFAVTNTSRGCPFKCIFCAGKTVSGSKVRMRSAQNVLEEIDILENEHGIREVVFLDDHFLFNKKRSIDIMEGIRDHHKDLTWKCANIAIFSLDEKLLELKRNSGCYQITVSIESGDQDVLTNIMKKPIKLTQAKRMVQHAKDLGFEVISNFVIGLPGETWEQIRRTIAFAASLDIDLVNFHVATPLPKTRLMDIYKDMGLATEDNVGRGYTTGVIETDEFTSLDLQILRAYEWDRINFHSPEKIEQIASMEGITPQDVHGWRKLTRRNLGSTLGWKHQPQC